MKRVISVAIIALGIWFYQRSKSISYTQESPEDTSARKKTVSKAQVTRQGPAVEEDDASPSSVSIELDKMVGELNHTTDPIDRHLLLMHIVDKAYKDRSDPDNAALLQKMAETHLSEFPEIKPVLKKEMNGILPRVTTFQKYATFLTENEQYKKAIEVCEKAIEEGLHDGTKSGFEGRIERIKKKMPA